MNKSGNPIIFLDVDGVMNHEEWYISDEFNKLIKNEHDHALTYYCPWTVNNLNKIIENTGAKIVFTSSHRTSLTLPEIKKLFKLVGIEGVLLGKTPKLHFFNVRGVSVPRGCEIMIWMKKNSDKLGKSIGKYKNYIIFDDDKDMLYYHRNNFIHVDSQVGITNENVEQAIKILKYGW